MSEQLHGLHEQAIITAKPPARRARADAWPKAAKDLLFLHYGHLHVSTIKTLLQPYFTRKVTDNMVFGKANRMEIAGRCPKHEMKLLPTSLQMPSEVCELPASNGPGPESV